MNTTIFEFGGTTDEADHLARNLAEWLNDDEDLRGSARLRMVPPAPGEQGALADATEVVSALGAVLGPVTAAFGVWLAERARSRRISFRVVRPDGARMELQAGNPADAAAVQQRVERFLNGADPVGQNGQNGQTG